MAAEKPLWGTGPEALSDAHAQRREAIDAYVEALSYPKGARGAIVAVRGRFAALDLFDERQRRGAWNVHS